MIESVPHMHSAQAREHRHGHLKVGPALLLVVSMPAGVTTLHYLTSAQLQPYHSIYSSLYYLPSGIAAVTWGLRGGMIEVRNAPNQGAVATLRLPMNMEAVWPSGS